MNAAMGLGNNNNNNSTDFPSDDKTAFLLELAAAALEHAAPANGAAGTGMQSAGLPLPQTWPAADAGAKHLLGLTHEQHHQLSGNWAAAAVGSEQNPGDNPAPAAQQPLPRRSNSRRKPRTSAPAAGSAVSSGRGNGAYMLEVVQADNSEADLMDVADTADADDYVPQAANRSSSSRSRRGRTLGAAAGRRIKAAAAAAGAAGGSSSGAAAAQQAALKAFNDDNNYNSGDVSDGTDPEMFGDGGGGCDAPAGGAGAAAAAVARSRQDRLKEKNRLAQRRFRARQKSMLEQMQIRMDDLAKQVDRGTKELAMLHKENHLLRNIVHEQQKVLMSAVMVQQQGAAAGLPGSLEQQQLQQLQELYHAQVKLEGEQQAG